jgi:hypothetical protein
MISRLDQKIRSISVLIVGINSIIVVHFETDFIHLFANLYINFNQKSYSDKTFDLLLTSLLDK